MKSIQSTEAFRIAFFYEKVINIKDLIFLVDKKRKNTYNRKKKLLHFHVQHFPKIVSLYFRERNIECSKKWKFKSLESAVREKRRQESHNFCKI